MFRFAKPDGSSFDFEYGGSIHAFDSGNDLVAICAGEQFVSFEYEDENGDIQVEEDFLTSCPTMANEWDIVIKLSPIRHQLLQQALSSAFSALMLCDNLVHLKKSMFENDVQS